MRKKVLCAMSGGVDSSVMTHLLNKEGELEVSGAFMRLSSGKKTIEAEKKVRSIAKRINIPFYVFDFRKEFEKEIIKYFVESYKKGVTPNPCVVCNKKMKFGLFLKEAKKLKMDFVATGHYASIKSRNNFLEIVRGKDNDKDQSYFLWQLNQKQLKSILLPLGSYKKEKVKKISKQIKLTPIISKESQDLCFIENSISAFLKKKLKNRPGKIVNLKGNVLGKHDGLWFYTIGQRKGINLSGGPFYVLKKNLKKNQLIVTKDEKELFKKELKLEKINWISGKKPILPINIKVQIRYGSQAFNAILSKKHKYLLSFKSKQKGISPGQSAVFYESKKVLGGGIIC